MDYYDLRHLFDSRRLTKDFSITKPEDFNTLLLNITETALLEELFNLGQQIAYRDFKSPTDAPFEGFYERHMCTEQIVDGDTFRRLGRQAYELGFYTFINNGRKTYCEEIQDLAQRKFRNG